MSNFDVEVNEMLASFHQRVLSDHTEETAVALVAEMIGFLEADLSIPKTAELLDQLADFLFCDSGFPPFKSICESGAVVAAMIENDIAVALVNRMAIDRECTKSAAYQFFCKCVYRIETSAFCDHAVAAGVLNFFLGDVMLPTRITHEMAVEILITLDSLTKKTRIKNYWLNSVHVTTLMRCIEGQNGLMLSHALKILARTMDTMELKPAPLIEAVPVFMDILNRGSTDLAERVLRILGSIALGPNIDTDPLIRARILPKLKEFLWRDDHVLNNKIKSEVCWVLSNICAGTYPQIQAVINEGLVPDLIMMARHSNQNIVYETFYALGNIVECGTDHHILHVIYCGGIVAFCHGLTSNDPETEYECVNGLDKILDFADRKLDRDFLSAATATVSVSGGEGALRCIAYHNYLSEVPAKTAARQIIERYFPSPSQIPDIGTLEIE